MAFFCCKNPQMWPKGPVQIVVWVAEGIRGYEVVSKHSKCSHTCGFFPFSGPLPENQKIACFDFVDLRHNHKATAAHWLNLLKTRAYDARKAPSPTLRRVSDSRSTVWATGFSVAQTVFSVAVTVRGVCAFPVSARFGASICSVAAVHVIGRKIHVLRTVCNNFAAPGIV